MGEGYILMPEAIVGFSLIVLGIVMGIAIGMKLQKSPKKSSNLPATESPKDVSKSGDQSDA